MKKLVSSVSLSLLCLATMAQNREPDAYKNAADAFMRAYNDVQPPVITQSFSDELLQQWENEKLKAFFEQQKESVGPIQSIQFLRINDGVANYKAVTEKNQLLVRMAINNDNLISELRIKPYNSDNYPDMERNKTKMSLPFAAEWVVLSSGEPNARHKASMAMNGALCFVMKYADNNTYKNNGDKNEDYYAFGQAVTAPCNAVVKEVVDGIRDNEPGDMNTLYAAGNSVLLKTDGDEYILLAHLKQGSAKVKAGDKVKKGETLALCGNSGNSSEPQIHFQVQNSFDSDNATVAKPFFEQVKLNKEGKQVNKEDYSPATGDKLKN